MDTFAVRALLAEGLTVAEVAARLHYQPKSVARVRWRLRKAGVLLPPVRRREVLYPYAPPDLEADARDRALERGAALAAAKVAAGQWALPRAPRAPGAPGARLAHEFERGVAVGAGAALHRSSRQQAGEERAGERTREEAP